MSPKYRDLNAPPGKKMADVVKALREKADSSKTGAHGVKHMGVGGDSTWVDPVTGAEESVRALPPRIDATQEAIDEAKVELELAQGAIDDAKQAIVDERTEREQLAIEAGQKFVELDGHLADANGKLDLAFPDGAFDVADELSRTVRSTMIQYALGPETTPPTSGWSTTSPTRTPGAFIWFRTVVTYGDDSTSTSGAALLTGNAGAAGADGAKGDTGSAGSTGAQGVGVASVTPYFRDVAAGATKPAKPTTLTPSGWSTTEPAWVPARDLYRVERVLYTNNAFAYTEVSKIAAYAGIDAAMAAANGKNLNTYTDLAAASKPGPAPAPNSSRTVGDVHRNRDTTTGEIWSEYQWTGTAWKEVSFGDPILRSLDVGKITGGTGAFQEFFSEHFIADTGVINQLWLNELVGKIATFQSLTVAPGNMIFDPTGATEEGRRRRGSSQWDAAEKAWTASYAAVTGNNAFLLDAPGAELYAAHVLEPGREYRIAYDVKVTGGTASARAAIRQRHIDGSQNYVGDNTGHPDDTDPGYTAVPANTWVHVERSYFAPDSINSASFEVQVNSVTTGATAIHFRNMFVGPKAGAVLIKNGTVGADKVIADEVAAAVSHLVEARVEKLKVTAGAEIDSAVILKLASEMITAGVLRTAETGQRVVIDQNGIVMIGVDPDGVEYEMVRLGPSGDNLLTVGESTISEEAVSAPRGEFEQLTVAGQDLTGMISAGPRGLVARARSISVGEWDGSGNEVWRLQVNFYAYPDRMYRIVAPSHYVQTRSAIPNIITEFLRWKDITDGIGVDASSPQLDSIIHSIPRSGNYTVPGMTAVLDGSDISSNPAGTRTQVVLSSRSPAGLDNRYVAGAAYPLALIIEDIGPSLPWTGRSWVHVGTPSQGSSGGAAPEPDRQERYTKTWTPQGSGGDFSGGDIVQGTYGSYGNRSGSWTMPGDMRTALQGSTIEKLEIYLYASHWYWGSGGTASIRATDGSSFKAFVGSAFTSAGWPRSSGRWVTVPSSWHSYFQSGAWKGIGVHTTSTNLLYYGRFAAASTRFRATYRR